MKESMIAAHRECTECEDIKPEKVLRPIGTIFRDWSDSVSSTDLSHWIYWEVVAYSDVYRGRKGDTLLYERCEEIKLADNQH